MVKISRFSRENIDRMVDVPPSTLLHTILIDYIAVFFIDFWPFLTLGGWIASSIFIEYSPFLFISILMILYTIAFYYFYIIFLKFYLYKTNKYKIKIKGLRKNVKFVFISDIHLGNGYSGTNRIKIRRLIKALNNIDADLIVFGGDFLTNKIEYKLIEKLKEINAPMQIGVYGNHDSDYLGNDRFGKFPEAFLNAMKATNIKFLNNSGELIELNGQKIFFGGIPDLYSKNFNFEEAFKNAPKDSIKILISHNPDIIDFIEEGDDIDLILSGHNHSGQLYIKSLGLTFPMPTKHKWLTQGIFQINKRTKLFLSQGAGYSGTRVRIGTDAEICVLELNGSLA